MRFFVSGWRAPAEASVVVVVVVVAFVGADLVRESVWAVGAGLVGEGLEEWKREKRWGMVVVVSVVRVGSVDVVVVRRIRV